MDLKKGFQYLAAELFVGEDVLFMLLLQVCIGLGNRAL